MSDAEYMGLTLEAEDPNAENADGSRTTLLTFEDIHVQVEFLSSCRG